MSDAMRQIKAELGEEAIIVSSREEDSGWVRVTAAVEQVNAEPENVKETLKREEKGLDEDAVVEAITDSLLKHRVPASVSDKLIAAASAKAQAGDPRRTLAAALEKTFSFKDLHGKKPKPVILVGPPGAGKTLMAAKLAAEAVLNGHRPAVVTTDITRAGGIEQLQAFLDILSLPLHQAADAKALKSALTKTNNTLTIIDTGGLNPFDPQEMKTLARLLGTEDMDAALVLPAGIDAEESAEIAQTFEILGVRKFIPTRLDFARRLGGILSAAEKADLAFTLGSHTPQVANGTMILKAQSLATLLMPQQKRGKS